MSVMTTLKSLVQKLNIAIMCSVHQPRKTMFSLFDDTILMAKGGNLIYSGAADEVIPYFKSIGYEHDDGENPADFLLDISTGTRLPHQAHINTVNGNTVESNNKKSEDEDGLICDSLSTLWINYNPQYIQDKKRNEKKLPMIHRGLSPTFTTHFIVQLQRSLLILERSWREKLLDSLVIVGGVAIISWVEGVTNVVDEEHEYIIPFHDLRFTEPGGLSLNMWKFVLKPIPSAQL